MASVTTDQYIWHATIETQHTRRSFRSEVDGDVLGTVAGWLANGDRFDLPGGYECRILTRGANCMEAEVYSPAGVRMVRFGVASKSRCGQRLWERLGGDPQRRPAEPWCGASLDPALALTDPEACLWISDFERCLAWAFLESHRIRA